LLNLVATASRSRTLGAEKLRSELWKDMGPTERLAAATCHLAGDIISTAPRATKNAGHADLPEPVMKAWDLLLKLKAEPKDSPKKP
jgi:hypothetical protein